MLWPGVCPDTNTYGEEGGHNKLFEIHNTCKFLLNLSGMSDAITYQEGKRVHSKSTATLERALVSCQKWGWAHQQDA